MFHGTSALLFDLDGTISDPGPGLRRCVYHALDTVGVTYRPSIDEYIGPPLHDWLTVILERHGNRDDFDAALAAFRKAYDNDGPTSGKYDNNLYDGMAEALANLNKEGFRLFVATSKPTPIARDVLAHFGLTDQFVDIAGSEMDGSRRNKDEVIAYVLSCHGLTQSQTVMIGDRKHDMIGAEKNGLAAIGVTWGYGSADELTAAGAKALAAQPPELVRLLRTESGDKVETGFRFAPNQA